MKIPVLCKSALDKEQLFARRSLDVSGIELQLLGDFVDNPLSIEEYINILDRDIDNINAIHVPLRSGEEIVCIQHLSEKKYQEIFTRICFLADEISKINNKEILVVIHNDLNLYEYIDEEEKYLKILNYLERILRKYKNIKIGIENVIPYKPPLASFSNGCLPNYTDFILDIRDRLNTKRVGSVLDTCHAIVSIKIMDFLDKYINKNIAITIEDYYKANKDICFLVHLCNVEDLGFNKMQHGTGFSDNDIELMSNLMELHEKYIPQAIITLEVNEPNYTDCKVYRKSKEILDLVISSNKIKEHA